MVGPFAAQTFSSVYKIFGSSYNKIDSTGLYYKIGKNNLWIPSKKYAAPMCGTNTITLDIK